MAPDFYAECNHPLAFRAAWRLSNVVTAMIVPVVLINQAGPLQRCAFGESPPAANRQSVLRQRPPESDFTASSLRRYQSALLSRYGGLASRMPLDAKAAHLEWVLRRYHLASNGQVYSRVTLPNKKGKTPQFDYHADNSTWNGALLAAMSYKYAVTKDKDTLKLIGELLDGMHLYQQATGKPGLLARVVLPRTTPIHKARYRYKHTDGTVYHFRSDPAKGTYNQVVAGYAALMMHAGADLPRTKQNQARNDLTALVFHLVKNDYRIMDRDGEPTPYGDLRPRIGSISIPFNAQVTYMIVAAATFYPASDAAKTRRIVKAFRDLRNKHHVYYENPLYNLVCPQRVAANPFVKGMNDRNHVINAAFTGLMLELDFARKHKREPGEKVLYQLGRTMYWGMHEIQTQHNALCNFMWAGLLSDAKVFKVVVPHEQKQIRRQVAYVTAAGIEQLRRFPIDRFYAPGREVHMRTAQWSDARDAHDSYFWKGDPFARWERTGPPTNVHFAAIDYLYAYWLMRYFQLQKHR